MKNKQDEIISTGYEPRPLQQQLHNNLKRFNVLVCHRRFGKCHTASTPVLTKNGWKKIIDVKAGDEVFTPKGKFTKVLAPYQGGMKTIYKVYFNNGEVIETDDEHLWYAEPSFSKIGVRVNRKPWKAGKVMSTKQLMEDPDFKFIPVADALEYPEKDLPIDPWLLGYWLGNGNKDAFQCCCSTQDLHLFSGLGFSNQSNKGSGCSYFYFSNMKPKMRDLNVMNNKHIPFSYLQSSIEQRKRLLAGLMDSDGSVSISGQCTYDSSDYRLIKDVKFLIESLGLKCSMSEYDRADKDNIEYRLSFTAKDFLPFTLKRKNELVRLNDRPLRHKIVGIEKTDRLEYVYCISIEDEGKLFLIGKSLIPTHNTVFSICEMIDKGLRNEHHNPVYAYIAPTYKQAKMIAWEYVQFYTRNIPGFEANKSELTVTIHRQGIKKGNKWIRQPDKIRYVLLGADNPDALRGIYLDGAIIDEYAQCDPILWGEIVRPTLSDRMGWAIFIGTPKGANHFLRRLEIAQGNPKWFWKIHKASETGIIPKRELDDMREDLDESEYEQELECSFSAAIKGSYFGALLNTLEEKGRVGDYFYDSSYPVDTYWDLGIGDALTIWYRQKLPGSYRYIDYDAFTGISLPEVVKVVKEKEYSYGRHVLPWDGKARELGTGLTRQETLLKLGLRCDVQKRQTVDDRISAIRILLKKCTFNRETTQKGLECLKNYQKEWDSKLMMFKNKPKHDWASHGTDSFGYSALDDRESYFANNRYENMPRQAESEYDELGGVL